MPDDVSSVVSFARSWLCHRRNEDLPSQFSRKEIFSRGDSSESDPCRNLVYGGHPVMLCTGWIVSPTYAAPGVVCVHRKTPQNTTKHVAYVDCRVHRPVDTQLHRPETMQTPPTPAPGCTGAG